MKKNKLKSGMILQNRNGYKMLVVGDKIIGDDGYIILSNYNDDLKHTLYSELDIIKVYNYNVAGGFSRLLEDDNLVLVWERKEIKLTEKEIEFLKALKLVGFNFLARDRNSCVYAYNSKPHKETHMDWSTDDGEYIKVNSDAFTFIKWEYEEPTEINSLLENEKLCKKLENRDKKNNKNKVEINDGFRYYPQPNEVPKAPPIKKKQDKN